MSVSINLNKLFGFFFGFLELSVKPIILIFIKTMEKIFNATFVLLRWSDMFGLEISSPNAYFVQGKVVHTIYSVSTVHEVGGTKI